MIERDHVYVQRCLNFLVTLNECEYDFRIQAFIINSFLPYSFLLKIFVCEINKEQKTYQISLQTAYSYPPLKKNNI